MNIFQIFQLKNSHFSTKKIKFLNKKNQISRLKNQIFQLKIKVFGHFSNKNQNAYDKHFWKIANKKNLLKQKQIIFNPFETKNSKTSNF